MCQFEKIIKLLKLPEETIHKDIEIITSWIDPYVSVNYPYAVYIDGEWVGSLSALPVSD